MIGCMILLIAGICQGSFGLGYKKFPPFAWSVFWGIYSTLCSLTALLFTIVSAPQAMQVFVQTDRKGLYMAFVMGAIWGLSAICFSKAIARVGMSFVYGISMGISTIVGSVTPMLLEKNLENLTTVSFWLSLLLTLAGVGCVTAAGIKRDGKLQKSTLGMLLSVAAGIGSGFMNVGFSCGDGMRVLLEQMSVSELGISAVRWLPVLLGGNLMAVIWCIGEATHRREWNTLFQSGAESRIGKLFGVSIIWYSALMLYGYASYLLGEVGDTIGWILFNSLALMVSVFWGVKTGEWRRHPKTMLFVGCGLIIASWIFAI